MRIYKDKKDLDKGNVKSFFEGRKKRFEKDPLTAVLYQDNNPELAHERDEYERSKILPLLDLNKNVRVLDIGCGIGRWAEAIASDVQFYYGIDFAEDFIEFAQEKYRDYENVKFKALDALKVSRETLGEVSFDRVIIAGLLLYLNDSEVEEFFLRLADVLQEDAIIYLREPVGIEQRLTLDNIWSEDLEQHYSAIYRTREELLALMGNMEIVMEGDMYERVDMNNRSDTKQYFYILKKRHA